MPGAMRARAVELRRRKAELLGVAADVVQREQAVVAIERRVLDALGHHWRGELLEPARELAGGRGGGGGGRGKLAGQRVGPENGNPPSPAEASRREPGH